jgi:hypothetical protein
MPDPTFKSTAYQSAAEKLRVYKAWVRFLRGGLKKRQFTKALYDHLYLRSSFIAWTDIHGFYATYFLSGDTRIRFLNQFLTGNSAEVGGRFWLEGDAADINQAFCTAAREFAPALIKAAGQLQRDSDVARAKRLLAPHGLTVAGEA